MWVLKQQSDLRPNKKKEMLVIPSKTPPHTHKYTRIRKKTVDEAAKDLGGKACRFLTINQFCCKSLKYNLKSLRPKLKLYGGLCKLTNTAEEYI